jgi:hypothetical protein
MLSCEKHACKAVVAVLDFRQQEVGMVKSIGVLAGIVLAALIGIAAAPAVEAADGVGGAKMTLSLTKNYTASPWTQEAGWSNRAIGKLGFGVKNLLLGWTDLFVEPKETIDSGGNLLAGIGIGLKDAVENTLGGAVHIITFPLTELDAPLPEGGTQLLSS